MNRKKGELPTTFKEGRDSEGFIMKKYTKLVLVVVALVSSICFLMYKYRYDRLYNVLQVMEVFGTPDDPQCVKCKPPAPLALSPAWHFLSPATHIYSAYCDPPGQSFCNQVTALGVSNGSEEKLRCKLWYEKAAQPMEGVLAVTKDADSELNEEGKFVAFTFTCESKYKSKVPYAVSIFKDDSDSSIPIAVTRPVQSLNATKPSIQVCVLPDITAVDNTRSVIESLIFHHLVQVDAIRLYSTAVTHSVLDLINQLRSYLWISISTWNPPTSLSLEVMRALVTKDCYYQSKGVVATYIVLSSNQIIMPGISGTSIKGYLVDDKLSSGPNSVPVKKFCSEYPHDKKSSNNPVNLAILDSTLYNKHLSHGVTAIIHSFNNATESRTEVNQDIITVHEYGACDRYDFSETDKTAAYDDGALKFTKHLINIYNKFTS